MADEDKDSANKGSEGDGGKAPRVWSQKQLDGQKAFKLKAALKKGALLADDQAWLDEWTKAHPPQAKPAAAPGKVIPIRERDVEVEVDYPDPERLEGAPKVDVANKAKAGGAAGKKSGPRWQAKYAESLTVELAKADGTKIKISLDGDSGREVACTLGASVICGVYQWLEAGLATVGKKPLVPVEMMFGAVVLTLDKYLPAKLAPEPEHVMAIGFAAAAAQYGIAYKAIAEGKKKQGAADQHKRELDLMRERTRQTEASYAEANRAKEVTTHAAHATPPAPPPQAAPPELDRDDRDRGPLLDKEPKIAGYTKPPNFDLHATHDLPPDAVI